MPVPTEVQRLSRRLQARFRMVPVPPQARRPWWYVQRPRTALALGLAMTASGTFEVLAGDSRGGSGELLGLCGAAQMALATVTLLRR